LNAKTNAKTTKSSITGSKKKSNKNSSGLGGDGNDVKGGGGQVHVFAAQQPYGEVGLFGGPGQPPAKSQSRPQDSYRVKLGDAKSIELKNEKIKHTHADIQRMANEAICESF